MAITVTDTAALERRVRDFAAEFTTPAVCRAIELAEQGLVTWRQAAQLCTCALQIAINATPPHHHHYEGR